MEHSQPKKVLIVDPILEPLKIRMESDQFVLFRKPEKGDDIVLGYYTRLDLCLKEVVKQKMLEKNDTKVLTISEYIQQWREMIEEFMLKIKLD